MNLFAKPISSPGRPEKYTPPLMRFLKSNAASKSRGKSRSSPMFIRNKKNNNVVQEPTSPKVTCIGQVRSKARTSRSKPGSNRLCSCFKRKRSKPMFFSPNFGKKIRPRWLKLDWSKCLLFFRSGYCRKSEIMANKEKIEEDEDGNIEKETEYVELDDDLRSTCPPKNALLLTRCRSAPYRSSSQISRFCPVSETREKTEETEKTEDFGNENEETEKPISEKGDLGQMEKKLGDLRLIESIISRKSEEISRIRAQPLVLMRCKSEPAKTGERLNPPKGMREKLFPDPGFCNLLFIPETPIVDSSYLSLL